VVLPPSKRANAAPARLVGIAFAEIHAGSRPGMQPETRDIDPIQAAPQMTDEEILQSTPPYLEMLARLLT